MNLPVDSAAQPFEHKLIPSGENSTETDLYFVPEFSVASGDGIAAP